MCTRGDIKSITIRGGKQTISVDRCIAPIVIALNGNGVFTEQSCCGHGKNPGIISLSDGRQILIAKDFKELDKIRSALFVPLNETEEDTK